MPDEIVSLALSPARSKSLTMSPLPASIACQSGDVPIHVQETSDTWRWMRASTIRVCPPRIA
ncbi:hypothetical protein B0T14DRAFT_508054 [Immersiella caudata]|uniref:Uncharacterized protein n=1 Tax=Immersiella caudata TaxID=314043 RepID=A0AA39XH63_9PEZI|nr:hypothetical protein B0T14DRAFT_508054 [Immersiella caudata]